MFRLGHYGAALLAYAPVGAWLISLGYPATAVAGGGAVLWLTMLPDWDHRAPFVSHRGPTHTLAFAGLVAGATWGVVGAGVATVGLGEVAAGPVSLSAFAAAVVALSLLAHLGADLLTPMGVALFWPVTDRRYSLSLAPADSTLANYGLFALGVFATGVAAYVGVRLLARGVTLFA